MNKGYNMTTTKGHYDLWLGFYYKTGDIIALRMAILYLNEFNRINGVNQ